MLNPMLLKMLKNTLPKQASASIHKNDDDDPRGIGDLVALLTWDEGTLTISTGTDVTPILQIRLLM